MQKTEYKERSSKQEYDLQKENEKVVAHRARPPAPPLSTRMNMGPYNNRQDIRDATFFMIGADDGS